MDVVLRLRELRRVCGLTQAEAARRAQLGSKTLSSFESGARIDSMKVSQLLRLLAIYDVDPRAFFDDSLAPGDFSPRNACPDVRAVMERIDACPPHVRNSVLGLVAAVADQLVGRESSVRPERATPQLRITQLTA